MSRVSYPSPFIITKDTVGSDLEYENLSSQINGSNQTFTLTKAADEEKIYVYYNGLLNNPAISARTETSFTLDFAPSSPDTIQVIYSIKGNPGTTED
jgi:hypothetical protein|tara:strand:- start:544 stop:834 length:291 start_codon:yes stop_codon:yes gene_type:complete